MKLKQVAFDVATKSMKTSANKIMVLNSAQKDNTSCGVSLDGTWQKRGYSSLNGCATPSLHPGVVRDPS
ncbi:unnamed protein product [Larinioides sclopetarius]|uniref:Mutator-like transposase domain-containing protein n=1 Tax=Larinioides sclopetarius TaxID=280406 RepID=A0AAV2AZW1_9ARAC